MIFLILQVVFASLFTLVIKWAQNREREDVVVIGCVNYIAGALMSLPAWLSRGDTGATTQQVWGAIISGGSMGLVYFTAYFFAITLILWVGASAASAVSVLSILLPITFAAFYWGDVPTVLQMVGIGLATLALLLLAIKPKTSAAVEEKLKRASPWLAPFVLLTFFLLCGCSRIAQDAFDNVSVAGEKPTFVLATFVVSGFLSIVLMVYRTFVQRKPVLLTEIGFGLMLGLSNMLQALLILYCLQYYPGFVVFPVTSAGSILFTMLVATIALGERLNVRSYVGIGITVVAMFLLQ